MLQQVIIAALLIVLLVLIRISSDRYIARWRARQRAHGMDGCMPSHCGGCGQKKQEQDTTI